MEEYTILPLSFDRKVTLSGTNIYPKPSMFEDQVSDKHCLLYIFDGEWEIGQDGKVKHRVRERR